MKSKKPFDFSKIFFNTGLLVKEMMKRGINVKLIGDTEIIKAVYKKHSELLFDLHSSLLSYPLGWVVNDKFYAKQWLRQYGIAVAEGCFFPVEKINDIITYAKKIGFPVVIKPTMGSHGDNVWIDIASPEELLGKMRLFKQINIHNGYVLLEKQFNGNEYRIFITKNDFIAAVNRIPASVIGDGTNNILQLMQRENHRRMNPRNTCLCEFKLDVIMFDFLEKHKLSLDSIPKKGERVFIRNNSNVSTGGNCFDVTDQIHHSIKELAFKILNSLPNLSYVGFDLICKDISKPLTGGSYIVCELNSSPGLSLHMMPEKGKPRDVAGAFVDLLFPETIHG